MTNKINGRKSDRSRAVPSALNMRAVLPVIKRTRLTQSMYETLSQHDFGGGRYVVMLKSDYKRLERNKYAPWKRGDLSGLPV